MLYRSKLLDAATLVAATTGFLYLLGSSFQDGFCDQFGLPPDLFTLSFQKTVMNGFLALFSSLKYLLGYAVTAGISLLLWWFAERVVLKYFPANTIAIRVLFAISFFGVAVYLAYSTAHRAGHLYARKTYMQLSKQAESSPECVPFLQTKVGDYRGYVFICSTSHCAVLVDKRTLTLPISSILKNENIPCSQEGKTADDAKTGTSKGQ